jgi:hypothetical protein
MAVKVRLLQATVSLTVEIYFDEPLHTSWQTGAETALRECLRQVNLVATQPLNVEAIQVVDGKEKE